MNSKKHTKKDRFTVRNCGDWQQLPNDLGGSLVSNESLVKEFVRAMDSTAGTPDKYAQLLYEFAEWLAETTGMCLIEARRGDIQRFIHSYLKGDDRAERDGLRDVPCGWKGALSPSSRKAYLAAIRELWRYSARMEYTDRDPTLGLATPKIEHAPGLTISSDQIRRFLDAPGNERDRVQAYLLVFTAARSSALRWLLWSDVDFTTQEISLRSKGGKTTQIPMHPELYGALRRWQQAQRKKAETNPTLALALEDPETAYLLLTWRGLPLSHSTIAKQVKWRAVRCGVTPHGKTAKVGKENKSKLHPHALRRSWATIQLNAGARLEDIADMLQHKSIETTRTHYAFTSNDRRRKIATSFNV
jgi:integrase/recombinase XerD